MMLHSIAGCLPVLLALVLQFLAASSSYPWPDKVLQHKGYITLKNTAGVHYFYWFFQSRGSPSSDPLLLWLTGGPGCSGELALFLENGPFVINGTSEPTYNQYGWNNFTNLLYIDQPGGTGFSYVDKPDEYVSNEKQIAADMVDFLSTFFSMYPDLKRDMYIFGESYGGHYVPAISQTIIHSDVEWASNLKGIGLGNSWTDPFVQYGQYGQFAYDAGMITKDALLKAQKQYIPCKDQLNNKNWDKAYQACEAIEDIVLEDAQKTLGRTINPYDYQQACHPPPLCYNMTNLTVFLNRDDIREDLGVGQKKWVPCASKVEQHLLGDWVKDFHDAVSSILNKGIKVLVYSGKLDFICNYYGGRAWTNATQWSGQEGFQEASFKDWTINGALAGQVKFYKELTFLQIEHGTHQVPMTLPKPAFDMLDKFIHNKPFAV